uniref:Polypeptide N-acetylgalactosaminyltransferase n=1 Tax=Lepeophtheirus salmonis TaxID=72036 RepID=A0A0K2TIP3_LEPSM
MLVPIRKLRSTLPYLLGLFALLTCLIKFLIVPLYHKKIDWHDYDLMANEALRNGKGEHGLPIIGIPKKKAYSDNGFNGDVSDLISIHRSVPDIRNPGCKSKRYRAYLPRVSFVIPFHNEHPSVLFRTFHSILRRAPRSLIKEIILVDDASTQASIKQPLMHHIAIFNLSEVVKVVRLPERGGLITARLAGAKKSLGDVIVFLDSHTEANANFLPPLLEPIAEDYRTVVCPFIDVIDHDTFAYSAQDEGRRGAFDWQLFYKRLPLLESDLKDPTKPFNSPVMAGGLFAISARFFWELGGYDEGLQIWGGEQYELSFKIWQCGGKLVDSPCSRIGHIYRAFVPFSSGGKDGYMLHNHKRVIEVWMDEYKEFVYKKTPSLKNINPGDLSKQKEVRQRLQCKSFKWFMEEIAFDLVKHYPAVEPPDFASGFIRTVKNPNLCIGSSNEGPHSKLIVTECSHEFRLSFRKDMRFKSLEGVCWDAGSYNDGSHIGTYSCHGQQGNQLFKYDLKTKRILQGGNNRCLEHSPIDNDLVMKTCADKISQQWVMTEVNLKLLNKWI